VRCVGWFHQQPISRIFATCTQELRHKVFKINSRCTRGAVHERDYLSSGCIGSTSTSPCTGLLISRPRRLYINDARAIVDYFTYVVRPDASAPRAAHRRQLCRASDHCISRCDYSSSGLHRLYYAYAVHPDVSSRRSTSRRSVALALAVRPVTASHDATTRCLDCTGSTAPMMCIQMPHLAARLLVGRSHWLSPCVRSLRLAARLLVIRIAPALLRLCRASGRAVLPLDFLSVGRTSSRRVPVTASRGVTARRLDCTGSTAHMSCIWTRRLTARC
jgi:hypothetical protein